MPMVSELCSRACSELVEDLVGRDLVLDPHREPVLEEQIDPGTELATLGDLVAPPVVVEVLPVRLAPRVDVGADLVAALEHVVLDQVRREQRGAAIVQRLEDELVVVRRRQRSMATI